MYAVKSDVNSPGVIPDLCGAGIQCVRGFASSSILIVESINGVGNETCGTDKNKTGAIRRGRLSFIRSCAIPESVDFAVIGAGFAGCAAAAWRKHAHQKVSRCLNLSESARGRADTRAAQRCKDWRLEIYLASAVCLVDLLILCESFAWMPILRCPARGS